MVYRYRNGKKLQHFYSIEIQEEGGTQWVYFNSTIHVDKRVKMPVGYGLSYTHQQILNDHVLGKAIFDHYGDVYVCECHN